jgi:hypothetical protein
MSPFNRPNRPTEPCRLWVSPVLKVVGTIADVVQMGAGAAKLSGAPNDMDPTRSKSPGQQ